MVSPGRGFPQQGQAQLCCVPHSATPALASFALLGCIPGLSLSPSLLTDSHRKSLLGFWSCDILQSVAFPGDIFGLIKQWQHLHFVSETHCSELQGRRVLNFYCPSSGKKKIQGLNLQGWFLPSSQIQQEQLVWA